MVNQRRRYTIIKFLIVAGITVIILMYWKYLTVSQYRPFNQNYINTIDAAEGIHTYREGRYDIPYNNNHIEIIVIKNFTDDADKQKKVNIINEKQGNNENPHDLSFVQQTSELPKLLAKPSPMTTITLHSQEKITDATSTPSTTTTTTTTTTIVPKVVKIRAGKQCFTFEPEYYENIKLLDDVMTAEKQPEDGKNIFFHETTCLNGTVHLNARQACAIESAAITNPTKNVFVLFTSPVGYDINKPKPPIIEALQNYTNIHWRNVNLWTYTNDTPAHEFIKTDALFKSLYMSTHTSDFMRLLSLYKWGGTHLDLDFIMKKSLEPLTPNYAGAESVGYIANGLLNFNHSGIGHELADQCLTKFVKNFDGNSWAGNGPLLITDILKKNCKTATIEECKIFTVLPKNELYAIYFPEWNHLFEEKYTDDVMEKTKNSMAVHFWNKLSQDRKVKVGSHVAYGVMAEQFCPQVYKSCGEYF